MRHESDLNLPDPGQEIDMNRKELTVEQMPALRTLIRASPWPGTGFAWLLFSLKPSFSEKVRASMISHACTVMLVPARSVQDCAKHSCVGAPYREMPNASQCP